MKNFKLKTHEQKIKECSFKKVQSKEGKWNLQNKQTGELISNIWFDDLGIWCSLSCENGNEHDIFGWNGLVFLEKPRPVKGVYPYMVNATVYNYNSNGELLKVDENTCGIW